MDRIMATYVSTNVGARIATLESPAGRPP